VVWLEWVCLCSWFSWYFHTLLEFKKLRLIKLSDIRFKINKPTWKPTLTITPRRYKRGKTVAVIGGVPPLRLRFSMPNHKYLISVFSTGAHPLQRLLAVLSRLNFTKMFREFDMVGVYGLRFGTSPLSLRFRLPAWYPHTCPMSTMWRSRNWLLLEETFTKWWCLGWWHRRRRDLTLHWWLKGRGGYRFWCISFWWSRVRLSSWRCRRFFKLWFR
jgi:hypothetical protein